MISREHLQSQIQVAQDELTKIQSMFPQIEPTFENAIDKVLLEAGVMDKVQALRNEKKEKQRQFQSRADHLMGRIAVCEEILPEVPETPKPAPPKVELPEGVTHIHGIEIAPLDYETALRVMAGEPDTVEVLGGTLEPKQKEKRLVPPSLQYDSDYDTDDPDFIDEDTGDHDPNLNAIRNMMEAQE